MKKMVDEALGDIPEGRNAIWESILELWRLKYLEEQLEDASEGFEKSWQQYTSGWLVSDSRRNERATKMVI